MMRRPPFALVQKVKQVPGLGPETFLGSGGRPSVLFTIEPHSTIRPAAVLRRHPDFGVHPTLAG